MRSSRTERYLAGLLLCASVLLGGSASEPLFEMSLAALAGVCFLWALYFASDARMRDPAAYWVLGVVAAIYLLQLVPTPWQSALQSPWSAGQSASPSSSWGPISLSPDATLYSFLSLAPTYVIIWLVAGCIEKDRYWLIALLVMLATMEAIIGVAQAVGAAQFNLYQFYHPRVATGLFASRNHFGDLFLLVTPLLFVLRQEWRDNLGVLRANLLHSSLVLLYFGAVIASASRASIVIFCVTVAACYLITISKKNVGWLLGAAAVAGFCGWTTVMMLPQTGVIKVAASRFDITEEGRWAIWRNSRVAIETYWPSGAGLSNFRLAYEAVEPLEDGSPSYINAAHNEYLQLLVEAGLPGAIAAILVVVFTGVRIISDGGRKTAMFLPLLGLLAMLAHATVDYPFRVTALNVIIGLLWVLCVCRANKPTGGQSAGLRTH